MSKRKPGINSWLLNAAALLLLGILCRGVALDQFRLLGVDGFFLIGWVLGAIILPTVFVEMAKEREILIGTGLYASSVVASAAFHSITLQSCMTYINCVPLVPIVWKLASISPRILRMVLACSLYFHASLGAWEVISRRSLFFTTWKMVDASYVGGFQRAASTVADPNYLAFALISLLLCLIRIDQLILNRGFPKLASIVSTLGVVLTFSRAGLVAITLFWFWQGITKAKRFVLTLVTLLTAALLLVATGAYFLRGQTIVSAITQRIQSVVVGDASTNSRALLQNFGFNMATQNLVLGVGPGRFQELSQVLYDPTKPFNLQTQVLNTFLDVTLIGGVIALAAMVLLWFSKIPRLYKENKSLFGGVIGVLVMMTTLDTEQFVFSWILLAILHYRKVWGTQVGH